MVKLNANFARCIRYTFSAERSRRIREKGDHLGVQSTKKGRNEATSSSQGPWADDGQTLAVSVWPTENERYLGTCRWERRKLAERSPLLRVSP